MDRILPSVIQDVITNMEQIDREVRSMPEPEIPDDVSRGFDVSKKASMQQVEVAMTPLFKNALDKCDHWPHETKRLSINDPQTKAEKWFDDAERLLLTKYFGTSKEYDENKDIISVDHYNVQCWQNLKDNQRDIQPGQAKERLEAAKEYTRATDASRVFDLLKKDTLFQKAVMLVLDLLPAVRASEEFTEINLPFMSKHTNVSDPYWQNDRNLAPDGRTYAQLTMDEAKGITSWRALFKYNLSTMYGRNQRGKGRLLIAVSRIVNLWLNRLEAVEIAMYKKKCSLFVGYGNDEDEKRALNQMVEDCKRLGLKMRNMDQSRYDRHVSYGFILLLGAMSMIKANGARSKEIALARAVLASKSWLVNGLTGKIDTIYGRIFSGFIDTNRGGGIINAVISTYCCMKQDPEYSKYIYDLLYYMLVMGDDNCFVYKILDHDKMISDMKELGFDVNPSKDEFGAMFLQYRLFEDPDTHQLVMAYAWTRVLRSMLFKETGKGLGPAGWTLAFWQQLAKLVEYPIALKCVVNLVLPFDESGLMLDKTVSEVIELVRKEDEEALKKAKSEAKRRRATSTFDALYDADPSKQRFADALQNGDKDGYLANLQAKIREARDPRFLSSCGIRVPA